MKKFVLLPILLLGACAATSKPAEPATPATAPAAPIEYSVKLPAAYWQFILTAMSGSDQKASDVRAVSQEIARQVQAQQPKDAPK